MSEYTLTYFDAPVSRGEECRLAFTIADVPFHDRRLKRDEWRDLKPGTPFGSLPILESPGKPTLSQCNAILSYIGRSYGLLPEDKWEAARLEALLCAAEDVRGAIAKTFGIQDAEELKRKRAELTEGPIQNWATNAEKQILGPFAGGESLSVADIKLFVMATWLGKGVLDHVPADVLSGCHKLQGVVARVGAHPKVVQWYAS